MKEIYPAYADEVAFYAVGTDPSESIKRLVEYADAQDYPWPMVYPGNGMLSDLRVVVQSTKIAFDEQGIITYRDGYGGGEDDTWRSVFDSLAEQ
jgi:hypothetical protein